MRTHSIGQVARAVNLATSTIRYYEQIGLLPEPERSSGKRRYRDDVLWRLSLIQQAKQAGFTLGEIRTLLTGFPEGTPPPSRWQELAGQKMHEIDQQIAELERARSRLSLMLDCACETMAECATTPLDSRA